MTTSHSSAKGLALGSTACFSVTAVSNPSTLPRVLEIFAKLGLIPHQCYASAFGADNEDLHIDLQFFNMNASESEHMARALRGCVLVTSVLTSQKPERKIA